MPELISSLGSISVCPQCGAKLELHVNIQLRLPAKFVNRISKQIIRKKECEITMADWRTAYLVCPKCGYTEIGI
jgi:predicted RNA-binding Zn-ribbon protein involved in translation (DUF1610 family)